MRERHAFTLIELLVVISIIALLIGILLPALGAARQTGRISASASNQRQIGIAMAAYQADNDEFFPIWQNPANGADPVAGSGWYWTTKLAVDNYIPGLELYADPTFDGDASFLDEVTVGGRGGGTFNGVQKETQHLRVYNWIHYGYNFVWVGSNLASSSGTRAAARKVTVTGDAIYRPARTIDMDDPTSVLVTTGSKDFSPANKRTDSSTPTIDPNGDYGAHVVLDYPINTISNSGVPHARYNDSVQNSWADGHVSTIKMPFTQEVQDNNMGYGYESYNGNGGLYGREALGNVTTYGNTGRGGADPGNYFDLNANHPDN